MLMNRRLFSAIFFGVFLCAGGISLSAADVSWADLGTDWSSGLNWVGGNPPANSLTQDRAVFPSDTTISNQPTLTSSQQLLGLVLNNSVSPYRLTGGSSGLVLGIGSQGIESSGAGVAQLGLVNPLRFDFAQSQEVKVTGTGHRLELFGTISGIGDLTKTGNGILTLSLTTNYHYGKLIVAGGELRASTTNGADYGNMPIEVQAGATVQLPRLSNGNAGSTREISGAGTLTGRTEMQGLKDVTFSGNGATISSLNGPFRWTFSGSSLDANGAKIRRAELELTGSNASLSVDATPISIEGGGKLTLNNQLGNSNNRYPNAFGLQLTGGTFNYLGSNSTSSSETFGALNLSSLLAYGFAGNSTLMIQAGAGQSAELLFSSVNNGLYQGNTLNVVSNDTLGASGNYPRVRFSTAPDTFNGIVSRVFVNGNDFAKYDSVLGIQRFENYANPTDINTPAATSAVLLNSNTITTALTATRSFSALKIDGSASIDLGSNTLNIGYNGASSVGLPGMILKTGAGNATIQGTGLLRSYSNSFDEIYINVNQGQLTLNAPVDGYFVKLGLGVLAIAPSANWVSNSTGDRIVIAEGVVRMNPGSTLLGNAQRVFSGGIIELTGGVTYNPTIGIADRNLYWTPQNDGGFAAYGQNATFSTNISWDATYNIQTGHALYMNSTTADRVITYSGSQFLGNSELLVHREYYVFDNPNTTTDRAVITGGIVAGQGSGAHFLKNGPGLLQFNNNFLLDFYGETWIKQGQLDFNTVNTGTRSVTPALTTITVMSQATIGGTGTINRRIVFEAEGRIAPGTQQDTGTTIGLLTLGRDLDASAGAVLVWELGALSTGAPGTNFDALVMNGGNLDFGTSSQILLNFDWLPGTDRPDAAVPAAFWQSNQSWKIVDLNGGTNLSNNLLEIINPNWNAGSFTTSIGTGTDDIGDVYLNFTVIPEPSMYAFLGLTSLVIACCRCRKQ